MATELTVPTLGMDMTEATVVRWLVSEGDEVEKGDPVLEIDTDKTSFEVEAPDSGTIAGLAGSEGEKLEVGTRVAYILASGEDVPERPSPDADNAEVLPRPEAPEPAHPETHSADGEEAVTSQGKGLRASPAARRLAADRGIELSGITGSGPNGRVYLSDVKYFKDASEADPQSTFGLSEPPTPGAARPEKSFDHREPLTRIRRIGAEKTQRSFSEVPHFYLRRDMNAEELVALHSKLKERQEVAPSLNDLIAFTVARTLSDHPRLNGRFDGGDLVVNESVNLGIAATTGEGLLVPVVKGAESMRLADLTTTIKDLLIKARDGRLAHDELSGGTFTISNLGMMGVDSFDAIINQPEAAILAIGSLRTTPLWDGNVWIARKTISMTLSVDHRVADGADGARFLQDLQDGLSNWELLM